jgi:glutamine amidotransferase
VIAVLDYGIGNLRSAEKALAHLGAQVELVTTPDAARGADGIVLPGVGAFGACAKALRASGLDAVCFDAVERGVPFLGICVGFQLLFAGSEESPDQEGLGILPGYVRRIPGAQKLPQMQWNRLDRTATPSVMLDALVGDPWFYFVHSYSPVFDVGAEALVVGTCEYGTTLQVAATRDALWGVQFHPEKSGRDGLALLGAFIRAVDARRS